MKKKFKLDTNLVRGGLTRSNFKETSEAIFLNSGFVYDSAEQAEAIFLGKKKGFQYSRYANPTVEMFEKRLALLDGSEACFATASGMAAVFGSMMCQLKAGDHVVSASALFGSCRYILNDILPKFGIEVSFIDGKNIKEWNKSIQKNTKIFFFESPSNPCLEIIDIKQVCNLAKKNKITTIVDNIFASPVLQQPVKFGADVVIYSGTKHIDGQGRAMGGAVCSTNEFKENILKPFLRHTGPCISPFNAWVLLKSLETIKIRVLSQSDNALQIARFLEKHKKIKQVYYPGLKSFPQYALAKKQQSAGGTMIAFKVKGGKKDAFKIINKLNIFDISNNLGDSKSLVTHPTTTTHKVLGEEARLSLGITPNLIRLSIGLEDINDLKEDLANSLK
ncbi:O-acetylhomoserine sulfhydrylase / O-succinylhomoserine sulfhydrylase [Candidatus Pelagibacter sp. IMCC9063]|uniref:O-succinylhomoserine sulfhydrylase n=1 Tax=Pelagibacter sp. (strain IMCC9063) TaxID=1002672 RepID=UPI0002046570|nr:O-succinylhomoserine sulfhydrylase [Candidatus Pelagibacter sp. IMCC9063]AEA81253.1 O-acetylhomoserine sulfhydrylase / O-succinylhomoserine sulfhydrylase [Candidatus Pelagibacter sp. IMCC9063]